MRRAILPLIVAIGMSIGAPVTAAVTIDTGPGPNSDTGTALYRDQYLAGGFDLYSAETIRSVFGWIGGDAGQIINLRLYSDGGTIPGSLLNSASFVTTSGPSWQGSVDLDWFLQPGFYWISFEGTALVSNAMPGPVPNPLEHYAYWEVDNLAWLPDNQLRFGVFISSDAREPPPVPEPSTWGTMLLGFAIIGLLLRRKRILTDRLVQS